MICWSMPFPSADLVLGGRLLLIVRSRSRPTVDNSAVPGLPRRCEFVDVAQAAIEDRRDSLVGFGALLGLVGVDWVGHEAPNHALGGEISALEFAGVVNGAGRARLTAKPEVHALDYIDIEL